MSGDLITTILKAEGPLLSGDLARRLEERGLTPEAARQRISRGTSGVNRLAGLVFPKGTRFFYLETDYNRERYWTALTEAVSKASPAYGSALAALTARGGIVPLEHFSIISGSPILQKGQVASMTVLGRLEAVKLVRKVDLKGVGTCVALYANDVLGSPDYAGLQARLLTEKILLLAVKDWARKLGMASYDKIAVRGESENLPRYGTFNWDLCGPSYLSPMVRFDKEGKLKPGFLVCDAVSGETVDEAAIAAFLRKCKLSASLRKLAPVMPVLIADRFTREALRLGKSHGVVMATPYSLFGKDVAVALATLLSTLNRAAAVAVKKPEVITELFDRLSQIEGAAINLRGAMFEMIVAHVCQREAGGSVDIGVSVRDPYGVKADIDVLRAKADEVRCYECKGYQPTSLIGLDDIKRWLEEKVPVIYRALRQETRFEGLPIWFEFWTTGGFTDEARAYLEEAKSRLKKYQINYRDGPDVRKKVASQNAPSLLRTLDEQYFNHPITRFDKKYDAAAAVEEVDFDLDLGLGEYENFDETPPWLLDAAMVFPLLPAPSLTRGDKSLDEAE